MQKLLCDINNNGSSGSNEIIDRSGSMIVCFYLTETTDPGKTTTTPAYTFQTKHPMESFSVKERENKTEEDKKGVGSM